MTRPLLLGRGGEWPFVGTFRGAQEAGGVRIWWAGSVAADAPPEVGWEASRVLDAALGEALPLDLDRRRAVSALWARLEGVPVTELGPKRGQDLTLLLVAEDAEGVAVSGVGLNAIFGVDARRRAWDWIVGTHPLLGDPGIPQSRPGALTAEEAPDWLVAAPPGVPGIGGLRLETVLPRCGMWQTP